MTDFGETTSHKTASQTARMVRREKSNYIIRSVAHALDVIEEFYGDADELGVT